jgi:predicted enzyme related to lactoylglutathione lyase
MPGRIVHFELPSKDADRAVAFWSGLFGWQFQGSGMEDIDYRMTQVAEGQGGAVYPIEDGGKGMIVYFDTDDIDASIARVRELGGEAEDKQPIPSIGWFTGCKDTEGNAFSLFQSDESAQPH